MACLTHTGKEILETVTHDKSMLIAIGASLNLPKGGILKRAGKEMLKQGYRVLPPKLPSMEQLAPSAIRLNTLIAERGYKTIEVHPTSTRKALNMSLETEEKSEQSITPWGEEETLECALNHLMKSTL